MIQEKLSAIFDSASTAIIVFTPQQKIVFSNAAALRLFGYPDMTNIHALSLFDPNDHLILRTFLDGLENKKPVSQSIHAVGHHKNGNKLPLRLTLKKISGLLHTSHYVGLIDTKIDLAPDIAQLKPSPLIYQEIQTSLDTLTSATQLLLESSPRPEQTVYLKLIASSGDHIKKTIHDALPRTRLSPEETDFDFREIIEDIKKVYKKQAKERELTLRFLIEEDIPGILKGNLNYLTQTLHYLLSNIFRSAIKGSIFIQIYMHQELQATHTLLFKITCFNTGLTYDRANSMITLLQDAGQNDKKSRHNHPFTQNAKQQIRLDYQADHSIAFCLYFPFTTSEQEEFKSTQKHSSGILKNPVLRGLKVLYVDDVTSNQFLMEGFCHHWEVNLESAFSGAEALEKIQHNHYDLVLMDIYMPDMDGFETVHRIRHSPHPEQADIPILAISASVSEDVKYKANRVGINDFIPKPIDPDFLFQKLAQFLK